MTKYDCIFFDRDGTINNDSGYISKLSYFKFFEFTIILIALFINLKVFVKCLKVYVYYLSLCKISLSLCKIMQFLQQWLNFYHFRQH